MIQTRQSNADDIACSLRAKQFYRELLILRIVFDFVSSFQAEGLTYSALFFGFSGAASGSFDGCIPSVFSSASLASFSETLGSNG